MKKSYRKYNVRWAEESVKEVDRVVAQETSESKQSSLKEKEREQKKQVESS